MQLSIKLNKLMEKINELDARDDGKNGGQKNDI